jgi:hypothetical protein
MRFAQKQLPELNTYDYLMMPTESTICVVTSYITKYRAFCKGRNPESSFKFLCHLLCLLQTSKCAPTLRARIYLATDS